jgi:hypothetical protein
MKNLLPTLLLFASGAACAADDAAVRHCRTLPDAARLACYDAMPLGDKPAPSGEQRFGMRPAPHKDEAEPGEIRSTVAGHFDGWQTGTQIKLANGQLWRVVDEYDAFMPDMDNPPVLITRGALGAYFLQIVGNNSSARVVRVR